MPFEISDVALSAWLWIAWDLDRISAYPAQFRRLSLCACASFALCNCHKALINTDLVHGFTLTLKLALSDL
jgi:hypothetical protein